MAMMMLVIMNVLLTMKLMKNKAKLSQLILIVRTFFRIIFFYAFQVNFTPKCDAEISVKTLTN